MILVKMYTAMFVIHVGDIAVVVAFGMVALRSTRKTFYNLHTFTTVHAG